ncbi:MAG TPA: hypothetical protein VK066_02335 [Chloroflexota bacterium]|nr:hypothetical protein [Chloroflexota bacterium]
MPLVVHSLQTAARGLSRTYASEVAYHAGVLLAMGLLALTLTLAVVQHLPRTGSADTPQATWDVDPDWWPISQ